MEFLTGILNILKNLRVSSLSRLVYIAGIASAISLFTPELYIEKYGLLELKAKYISELGIVFLLSLACVFVDFAGKIYSYITKLLRKKKQKANILRILQSLTPDEKACLLPYIYNQQNTCYFSLEDGVAGGLLQKRVLYLPTTQGNIRIGIAHNMRLLVREILEQQPELLEGYNLNFEPL